MHKLSIIIPCYNEEKTIISILKKINHVNLQDIEKEIIIVDDYSIDNTRDLLQKNKKLYSKLILSDMNNGKGASIKKGIDMASGDYIIIQDADLEYDPNDYMKLLIPLLSNQCDVVYGTRFGNRNYNKGYFFNRWANKILTNISNLFTHYKLTDMETCYKVFKKEIIKNIILEEKRFGFEPEITHKLAKNHVNIIEVSINYYPRSKKEGKKINFKDGLNALHCIIKYR